MITEDYVSDETFKLLKEKGFDDSCCRFVIESDETYYRGAPTLQMAMKWLREVHNLFVEINLNVEHSNYYSCIYKTAKNGFAYMYDMYKTEVIYYITYEQACEAAIKYCLEKLI